MIAIVLMGAAGRMGRAVEEAAAGSEEFRIKARIDRAGEDAGAPSDRGGGDPQELGGHPRGYESGRHATRISSPSSTLAETLAPGDVVVDFSGPEGAREAAEACAARAAGLVSGTTGLGPEGEDALRKAAERVPVLRASNFSLGVLALRRALDAALAALPRDWDIEIVERHHRQKVDSPSGTALTLAREAARRRDLPDRALRFGREGRVGARPAEEIGVHAVRGGTWVGDHTVLLAGAGEWLELRHVAQDRAAFARGALAAARFVASAPAGLYTLDHLILPPSSKHAS